MGPRRPNAMRCQFQADLEADPPRGLSLHRQAIRKTGYFRVPAIQSLSQKSSASVGFGVPFA